MSESKAVPHICFLDHSRPELAVIILLSILAVKSIKQANLHEPFDL